MAQTASVRAEARLRHLCCLGIGGEAVMPALADELMQMVGCHGVAFFFADDKMKPANFYTNFSTPYFQKVYFEHFHGRPDREPTGSFPDAIRTEFGVRDIDGITAFAGLDVAAFRRGEHWNEVHRPQGLHWPLRLYVHAEGRGRGLGCLTLHRDRRDPPWTAEEKRRVLALEPFFAHLLAKRASDEGPLARGGEATGLIVANTAGVPVHFTPEGRRLLFLATFPKVAPGADFRGINRLPARVARLCESLPGVLAGSLAAAPTYRHRNVWGGFTFRAHPFEGGANLVGITVTHHEPAPVRLVRRIGEMPLTRRQADVCQMLASGADYETIADRLGISKHTAIAHGRWIYQKLDVHSRGELTSKLLL